MRTIDRLTIDEVMDHIHEGNLFMYGKNGRREIGFQYLDKVYLKGEEFYEGVNSNELLKRLKAVTLDD